jgi:hypothetical protein
MKIKHILTDKPETIVPLIQKKPRTFERFVRGLGLNAHIIEIINKVLDSKAFITLPMEEKRNVMKVFIENTYRSVIVRMKLGMYMTEQDIQRLFINDETSLYADKICQIVYMMYDAGCLKSLRQIEELIYKSISSKMFILSSYLNSFGGISNIEGRVPIVELIGDKNFAKLTLFTFNACLSMESCGSNDVSEMNLNHLKSVMKENGFAEKWDKIIIHLIKKDRSFYQFLIKPLSTEQLFYLTHDNKDMSSLSYEDRAKLRAYL